MCRDLTYSAFIRALEEDVLLGQQCARCGVMNAPPTFVCRDCGNDALRTVRLSGAGRILGFTSIYATPEGFDGPYIVCLVQLSEGPRLVGTLLGVDPQRADLDLIGRSVVLSHLTREGDRFSAGRMVAIAFSLRNN